MLPSKSSEVPCAFSKAQQPTKNIFAGDNPFSLDDEEDENYIMSDGTENNVMTEDQRKSYSSGLSDIFGFGSSSSSMDRHCLKQSDSVEEDEDWTAGSTDAA